MNQLLLGQLWDISYQMISQWYNVHFYWNAKMIFQQVQRQLRDTIDSENKEYKRVNILRQESAIKRVLKDMWKELENINLNPLFSDEMIQNILQETCNISGDENQDFFESYVNEDFQRFFEMLLPINFSELQWLNDEQMEFVKFQMCQRLWGNINSDKRRALFLQVMKYTGFGYDFTPQEKSLSSSTSGIHLTKFAEIIWTYQEIISNILNGNRVLWNRLLMQLLDVILYYNIHWSLEDFTRQEQKIYGNEKIVWSLEMDHQIFSGVLTYRAQILFKRLWWNIEALSYENILEYYNVWMQYISGDMWKFQKLMSYISHILGCKPWKCGFNYREMAQKTWVSYQQWNPSHWKEKYFSLLLRSLIAIADMKMWKEEFSEGEYKKLQEGLSLISFQKPDSRDFLYERRGVSWKLGAAYIQYLSTQVKVREKIGFWNIKTDDELFEVTAILWKYCQSEWIGGYRRIAEVMKGKGVKVLAQSTNKNIEQPNLKYLASWVVWAKTKWVIMKLEDVDKEEVDNWQNVAQVNSLELSNQDTSKENDVEEEVFERVKKILWKQQLNQKDIEYILWVSKYFDFKLPRKKAIIEADFDFDWIRTEEDILEMTHYILFISKKIMDSEKFLLKVLMVFQRLGVTILQSEWNIQSDEQIIKALVKRLKWVKERNITT